MKLLEAEKVKEETKQSTQDRIKRVAKLNEAEIIINKRLNQLRDFETKESARFLSLKRAREAEAVPETETELGVRKSLLLLDIEELEVRKLEALKPIDEIQKKAEKKLEDAKRMISETQELRLSLSETKEDFSKRVEDLVDKEQDILQRDAESERKHNLALAEEKRLKESTEKLSAEWVKFHAEIHKLNKSTSYREIEIENARRVNENFKKSLDKKEKEQTEHDRQIADRYRTLGRAIEEARKKHNIKITL